jgi:hypothetical protein
MKSMWRQLWPGRSSRRTLHRVSQHSIISDTQRRPGDDDAPVQLRLPAVKKVPATQPKHAPVVAKHDEHVLEQAANREQY